MSGFEWAPAHHERLRMGSRSPLSGCERAPLTLSLSKGRSEPVEGFFGSVLGGDVEDVGRVRGLVRDHQPLERLAIDFAFGRYGHANVQYVRVGSCFGDYRRDAGTHLDHASQSVAGAPPSIQLDGFGKQCPQAAL